MKTFLVTALTYAVLAAASFCHAQTCRNCTSGACSECTVKVGVYGYTRPTWRPWPTTKEAAPGERKKVDRRLIRPEPYETPSPEAEAEGVPERAPDLEPPSVDPMPEAQPDLPPELPPPLRNKQPIPILDSSSAARPRAAVAQAIPATPVITRPYSLAPQPTEATAAEAAAAEPSLAAQPSPRDEPAERPIASMNLPVMNLPVSAQASIEHSERGNPLRHVSGSRTRPATAIMSRRTVSNAPVAVQAKPAALDAANPLR
jgi:hypothetical protein